MSSLKRPVGTFVVKQVQLLYAREIIHAGKMQTLYMLKQVVFIVANHCAFESQYRTFKGSLLITHFQRSNWNGLGNTTRMQLQLQRVAHGEEELTLKIKRKKERKKERERKKFFNFLAVQVIYICVYITNYLHFFTMFLSF